MHELKHIILFTAGANGKLGHRDGCVAQDCQEKL